ncbi:Riboflavin transporter [Pseudovibrio sp. Ad5]|uniref:DMT family transporter n=1 Tax=Pseudovibrio sp. Ad5 TaxID=989436 RepID=UPI0007B2D74D|nr:DMT family transporter [Pseudovibrio sp. Ad5]KZK89783.1 Riboflavin transporter [Pseudovibrio sp. Ad5]
MIKFDRLPPYYSHKQTGQPPISNNIKGALWALLATALFVLTTALAKIAATDYHILQILFFRQCFVFISALPVLLHSFPHGFKTKNPLQHAFRLTGSFIALSSGIWAVTVLPLTTATTLSFAKAFFVALLAAFFLGEALTRTRIFGILSGFSGVLVVMRPGLDGFASLYTLIPILGALGAAVALICVRKLSQTESTATLLAYQAIFIGFMSGLPMFWLWKTPDLYGSLLLATMGLTATIGQWTIIKALRLGEASIIGTIQYVALLYAALLGLVLFSELPDTFTLIGAAVIIFSALYMMQKEHRRKAAIKPT